MGRALVLLAAMGTKRTENLLEAMERQQTVRLLGAVSKVLADQARVRTTFDLAQQEAERIAAQARQEARETIDKATVEAEAIKATAQQQLVTLRAITQRGIEESRGQAGAVGGMAHAANKDESGSWPVPGLEETLLGSVVARIGSTDRPASSASAEAATPMDLFALPMEYFLIGHDDIGRPRIDQAVLETGLCGAVLCELVRKGLVTAIGGRPTPVGAAICADPIGDLVLRSLDGGQARSVTTWARETRRELFLRVAQRLADSAMIVPVTRRWAGLRTGIGYRPASQADALLPAVRLARFLLDTSQRPDERTYLLAALVHLTQLHRVLPIDLRPRQVRELLAGLLDSGASTLPMPLRAVLTGIDSAIATIAITPRIR